jgi:hypothetical protein
MDGSAAVRYILDNNIEGDLVEYGSTFFTI